MRKLILSALLAGVAFPAMAADMPLKAAPYVAPVSDWTGFYIGIHGGYGWGRETIDGSFINDIVANEPIPCADKTLGALCVGSPRLKGFVFGGQAGYMWQFPGSSWVGGVEIDYSAADIKGTKTGVVSATANGITETISHSLSGKVDALASARGRFGFLMGRDLLLYGTVGIGWGHKEVNKAFTESTDGKTTVAESIAFHSADNRFGWVAGGGLEWAFGGSGWRLRVEGLHYGFNDVTVASSGSTSVTGITLPPGTVLPRFTDSFRDKLSVDVVRAGLSYKF